MAKWEMAKWNCLSRFLAARLRRGQVAYTQLGHTPVKIARIYLRVSTDEQDLTRQTDIEQSTRAAWICLSESSGWRAAEASWRTYTPRRISERCLSVLASSTTSE